MDRFLRLLCVFLSSSALAPMMAQTSDYFAATTAEGVEMQFHVTDADDKLVEVYASGATAAIPTETMGAVTIPATVTHDEVTYTVKGISAFAFYDCGFMTEVTIPATVRFIGNHAFEKCTALASIYNNVQATYYDNQVQAVYGLERSTFDDDTYENATLYVPLGTKRTYSNYEYWSFFKHIVASDVVGALEFTWKMIGRDEHLFYRVTSDDDATVEVTGVDDNARKNGGVITIPEEVYGFTVTSIGRSAFSPISHHNVSVVIPNTIVSIGEYAFSSYQSKQPITLPESVKTIGQGAFQNSTELTSIVIPDGVETIGPRAFQDGYRLATVTMGTGVKTIGEYAFDRCAALSSVTIGENTEEIGQYAFNACYVLGTVVIPDKVTTLGNYMFKDCRGLADVTIGHAAGKVADGMFRGCTALSNVQIGDGITVIGQQAFYNCTALGAIELPDRITSIERTAFANCYALRDIELPASLTSLGMYAFNNCTSLSAVTIPVGVTQLDIFTFQGCTSLKDVHMSGTLNRINQAAFCDCTSLSHIDFPEGLTYLAGGAFRNCTSLQSVTLPSTMTQCDYQVFDGCTSLRYFDLRKCPGSVSSLLFTDYQLRDYFRRGIPETTILYLPVGNMLAMNNVVNTDSEGNATCASLTMGNDVDFEVPADFSVTGSVTNPRTVTGSDDNAYTLCLPYDYMLPEGMKAFAFSRVDDEGSLVFVQVDKVLANLPYLITATVDVENLNCEATDVKATPVPMTSTGNDDIAFKGTLQKIGNDEAAAMGAYILQANKEWHPVSTDKPSAYIVAGRAYLVPKNASARGMFGSVLMGDEATGIKTVDNDGVITCYDLQGHRIQQPAKGLYIKNGKKTIIK